MLSQIPFSQLGLSANVLRAIDDLNYTTSTIIQSVAIPEVLKGRDVLASAQTGTGKTASFILPILHHLAQQPLQPKLNGKPAALILVPTRELAAQVESCVKQYAKYLPIQSMVMFGGVSFNNQRHQLEAPVDILVATPGRLLDHVQQNTLDLAHVQVLVLDEADRMLDMGFIADIRKIMSHLPIKRQNLLFSATFSDEIRELASRFLKDPVRIEIAKQNQATPAVKQQVHLVGQRSKPVYLANLILTHKWTQVLVFTRTKHGANLLSDYLSQRGITSGAIHGNKSQNARTRTLSSFKEGALNILVATDIAARGLDIDQLPQVVNFELPQIPEDYVHRIGRTGRAGATGIAISLVDPSETRFLRAIERLIRQDIPRINTMDAPSLAIPPSEERPVSPKRKKPPQKLSKRPTVKHHDKPKQFKRAHPERMNSAPQHSEQIPSHADQISLDIPEDS